MVLVSNLLGGILFDSITFKVRGGRLCLVSMFRGKSFVGT